MKLIAKDRSSHLTSIMLRILRFHIQGLSLFFPNWVAKLLQDCASDHFSTPLAPLPFGCPERDELSRTGVCMSLPLLRQRGDTLLKCTSAKPGWKASHGAVAWGPGPLFHTERREPQPGFYAGHCGGTHSCLVSRLYHNHPGGKLPLPCPAGQETPRLSPRALPPSGPCWKQRAPTSFCSS